MVGKGVGAGGVVLVLLLAGCLDSADVNIFTEQGPPEDAQFPPWSERIESPGTMRGWQKELWVPPHEPVVFEVLMERDETPVVGQRHGGYNVSLSFCHVTGDGFDCSFIQSARSCAGAADLLVVACRDGDGGARTIMRDVQDADPHWGRAMILFETTDSQASYTLSLR